eukprot:gnl/MRDRNA2_/MRDRNA2_33284_c0_seq1.p1 gnl/MRDRNA2_/MRDRNA2_33284_c0~~gnl/MRDRNA2_/MRDRNA2_33284_c0_seq1.p1  ORF type:complete len:227 (+),score=64.99 gnl/MRDRNA2_/MRDRNA2_33284_c0_seq1:69-683(+)
MAELPEAAVDCERQRMPESDSSAASAPTSTAGFANGGGYPGSSSEIPAMPTRPPPPPPQPSRPPPPPPPDSNNDDPRSNDSHAFLNAFGEALEHPRFLYTMKVLAEAREAVEKGPKPAAPNDRPNLIFTRELQYCQKELEKNPPPTVDEDDENQDLESFAKELGFTEEEVRGSDVMSLEMLAQMSKEIDLSEDPDTLPESCRSQ